MSEDKLKPIPCGFCGYADEEDPYVRLLVLDTEDNGHGVLFTWVWCPSCDAQGPAVRHKEGLDEKAEAVRRWNTRADIPRAWWDRLRDNLSNGVYCGWEIVDEMERIEKGE